MQFEDTPEYRFSLGMRPACDRVLREVFGVDAGDIERFEKPDALFILDKEHAIDMRVRLRNGAYVLGQEKTLRHQNYRYRTFTIEYWQNRHVQPQEPGEFFKIASQFYLHGYADETETDFVEWKVLDTLRFMTWLKDCRREGLAAKTTAARNSRAAFLPIPYDSIPPEAVIAEWRKGARLAA